MAIMVIHWERRDNADRGALGSAALDFCRASRTVEGMRDCRFYWANADTVVVQADAESTEVFYRPTTPPVARALFALADLARQTSDERWMEPGMGQETYRAAGR